MRVFFGWQLYFRIHLHGQDFNYKLKLSLSNISFYKRNCDVALVSAIYTLFFIRTSNFGAEVERFFFCDLSLKTFLACS